MPLPAVMRARAACLGFAMLACWGCAASAQIGEGPSPGGATSAAPLAPVVVDGRTLMRLRGISAFPAARRAAGVSQRIEAVAGDRAVDPATLRVVDADDRTNVLAGETPVLSVFDDDARAEGMADRRLLAEVYRGAIAQAIVQYREERSPGFVGRRIVVTLVVIGVLAAALVALRFGAARLTALTRRRLSDRIEAVEVRSFNLVTANHLERTVEGLIGAVHWLLAFVAVLAAICYVLSLFPWTRLVAVRVGNLLVDPLRTMGSALLDALPGLAFVAVLAIVTRYLLRLLQVFFAGIAQGRIRLRNFAPEWAWPTYRLVRIAVVAFALVIAYPYIPGSSSDAFKGISLFFGLLMSLGAASVVANSLAGYALIYRRTFKVGDRIRVGDVTGDVVEMRQQVTHLRSVKNEIITIPSSTMLTSQVTNFSSLARTSGLVLHTTVGIGYETPWRQVEAMLLLAASRTDGLARHRAPFVLLKELGDFAVVYEINAYCDDAQAMERAYTALHRQVLDVFNEFGVAIMTPAYVADPELPKVVPMDQWYAAPARR